MELGHSPVVPALLLPLTEPRLRYRWSYLRSPGHGIAHCYSLCPASAAWRSFLFSSFLLAWQILGQSDLSQVLKATLASLRVTPGQF